MSAKNNVIAFTANTNRYSESCIITNVTVQPSAADWALILTDSTGATIFRAGGNPQAPFNSGSLNIETDSINPTTWTNITSVTIEFK